MKDKKSKRIILNFALSFCILIFVPKMFANEMSKYIFVDPVISEPIGQRQHNTIANITGSRKSNLAYARRFLGHFEFVPTGNLDLNVNNDGIAYSLLYCF
jgi:hypothetical protein